MIISPVLSTVPGDSGLNGPVALPLVGQEEEEHGQDLSRPKLQQVEQNV